MVGNLPGDRKIAVRRWLMVDHGYKRCTGYHALSCVAVRTFKPLEMSCGGLRWLVRVNVTTSNASPP